MQIQNFTGRFHYSAVHLLLLFRKLCLGITIKVCQLTKDIKTSPNQSTLSLSQNNAMRDDSVVLNSSTCLISLPETEE